MDKQQLQDLPWYSRVKNKVNEFNYYFVDNGVAVCFNDEGKEFRLNPETEVILLGSMKEYNIAQLTSNK